MELVPIIKTFLLYGSIFFTVMILISYILSKINNNKRNEDRMHDLVPNYLNKPKQNPNIRVIRRPETIVAKNPLPTAYNREPERTVYRRESRENSINSSAHRTSTSERTKENSNVYYIKSYSNDIPKSTKFAENQTGPTMDELRAISKAKRFVVLNTNLESGTNVVLNRFSKSYSYGR